MTKTVMASRGFSAPFYRPYLCLLAFAFFLFPGCADTKSQSSVMRERQDAALRDPMSYDAKDTPTVTGGGTGDFDKKAFDRDVSRMLNP